MKRTPIATIAAVLLILFAPPALAQRATERFIPLGQSPGLSATQTYVGEIASADAGTRTIAVGAGPERHIVRVGPATRIWIDRSGYGRPNTEGSFNDLRAGRRVEVKYVDAARRDAADWIKVVPEAAE